MEVANVIVEEESDLENQNSAEEVRGPHALIKKSENKQTMDEFSKEFPNFVALNKEEKAAFFEALTMARQNVEKQGVTVGEQFEVIHNEYLKFSEEDVQQASSCETFNIEKTMDVEDKQIEECTNTLQVTLNEKFDFFFNNTGEVVDLFMKKKKKEEQTWLEEQVDENQFDNSDEEFQLMDPNLGCVMMVLQSPSQMKGNEVTEDLSKLEMKVKSTPKFDALNLEEREIFFEILKQAHENILKKNPEEVDDILPYEAFLNFYEKSKDVAVFPTAVENIKNTDEAEEEHKIHLKSRNLKLNLKLFSGDNERLGKTVQKLHESKPVEEELTPDAVSTRVKNQPEELAVCRDKYGEIKTGDECPLLEKNQDIQTSEKLKEEKLINKEDLQPPKKIEKKQKYPRKERKLWEKKLKTEDKCKEELRYKEEEEKKKMEERLKEEKKLRDEELLKEGEKLRQEKKLQEEKLKQEKKLQEEKLKLEKKLQEEKLKQEKKLQEEEEEEERLWGKGSPRNEEKLEKKIKLEEANALNRREENKLGERENEKRQGVRFKTDDRIIDEEKLESELAKIQDLCEREKILKNFKLAELRAEGKFEEEKRLRLELLQNEELCKEEKKIHKKRIRLEGKLLQQRLREEKILQEKSKLLDKLLQKSSVGSVAFDSSNDTLRSETSDKKMKEKNEKYLEVIQNMKQDSENFRKLKKGPNNSQSIKFISRAKFLGALDNLKTKNGDVSKQNLNELAPNSETNSLTEEKSTSELIEPKTLSELKDSLEKVMKKVEKMEELLEEQKDQQKKMKKYKSEKEEQKDQQKKNKKNKKEKLKKTGRMTKMKFNSSEAKKMENAQEVMIIIEKKSEFFHEGVISSSKNLDKSTNSENEMKSQKVDEENKEAVTKIQKEEDTQLRDTVNEELIRSEILGDFSNSFSEGRNNTIEDNEPETSKEEFIKKVQLEEEKISVTLKELGFEVEKKEFSKKSETMTSVERKTSLTETPKNEEKDEQHDETGIKCRNNITEAYPIREASSVKNIQKKKEASKIDNWKSETIQMAGVKSGIYNKNVNLDKDSKLNVNGAYPVRDLNIVEKTRKQDKATEVTKLKSETTQTVEAKISSKKIKKVQSGATQTSSEGETFTVDAYPVQNQNLSKVSCFSELIPKKEYKTGKVVIVGDDVIEKIQNLIMDLEKKAKAEDNELENEYLQLVIGYIDYLSKVLGALIDQNRKQFKIETIAPVNVHWKIDEDFFMKPKRVTPFKKSLSDMNIDSYPEKASCCSRKGNINRKFKRSKSLEKLPTMKSSIALVSQSYSGISLDSKETEDRTSMMSSRLKRTSDLKILQKREKFSKESICELLNPLATDFNKKVSSSFEIDEYENFEYTEKVTKQKLLKTLVKLCGCGKAESLENLKRKNIEGTVGRRRQEASLEVFKSAERKKMMQSYRKD